MPALNITFTDDEMDALRAAAEREGLSLKALAHDAIMQRSSRHKPKVAAIAARIAEDHRELLDRLAR